MSDRCYLEKCRDRLYPEFVAGGITRKRTVKGEVVVFADADDLLRKTPSFYANATRRLDQDLGGAYQFARVHFGGNNLYMDAVKQNIRFAERINQRGEIVLRREPPATCH
jgi:lysyl-tRNA synthetase class I